MPAFTLLLALAVVSGSCQLVGGYEEFERSEPTAATPSQGPRPCDALPSVKDDPTLHGPVLRLIDDPYGTCFWMDNTEVTAGEYRDWLKDLAGSSPAWGSKAGCNRRPPDAKAFDPDNPVGDCRATAASATDPFAEDQPMRCVDWCEAEAYCRWAGKRLCKVGGPTDEWQIACSAGYTKEYPFDPEMPGGSCNYGQVSCSLGCGPRPAGQDKRCRPATDYPLDLGGNVEEWIDSCLTLGDGTNVCGHRGGSYLTVESMLKCSFNLSEGFSDERDPRVGFRCCASLTREESVLVSE